MLGSTRYGFDASGSSHVAPLALPEPPGRPQPRRAVLSQPGGVRRRHGPHLRPALDLCRRRAGRAGARRRHGRRYRKNLDLRGARRRHGPAGLPQCLPAPGRPDPARREDDRRQHRLPLPFLDLRPDRAADPRRPHGGRLRPLLPWAQAGPRALPRGIAVHLPRRGSARGFRRHGADHGSLHRAPRHPEHQGRLPVGHRRAGQLEAHHGEQPGMLPLLGQPSRADRAALRLRVRLLARGDGRDRARECRALRLHAPGQARVLGGRRIAVPRGRASRRPGDGLSHRAAAPRRGGRVPHHRHQGRLPPAPGIVRRGQARRVCRSGPSRIPGTTS